MIYRTNEEEIELLERKTRACNILSVVCMIGGIVITSLAIFLNNLFNWYDPKTPEALQLILPMVAGLVICVASSIMLEMEESRIHKKRSEATIRILQDRLPGFAEAFDDPHYWREKEDLQWNEDAEEDPEDE